MDEPKKKYRPKRKLGVLLLMLCSTLFALGQQTTIVGKVMDESGLPVIGATVQVKGTSAGTITDVDGNFKTVVKDVKTTVLITSFVGYETQEVSLKGRLSVTIVLVEAFNELQEVTVVAYGTQKKETLTGAISSVKTADLLQSPNASIANSLAGKITGLSSVQSSGQPGAEDPKIFIRGVGSLTEGGASPLILVDGVERSFFQMDPNEIENVTILKDASATAVFGVRGANGVVLVTTRRGEEGKARISINSSVGVQMSTRTLDMADSYTYASSYNELQRNDGRKETFDAYSLKRFELGDEPIMYPNIKWRDYMTNKAAIQTQHNLNITGGTKSVRYFISLGYLYQDGLFKDFGQDNLGYKYNRYNYRANLDLDITKSTVLKMGIGGIVGDKMEPTNKDIWKSINWSQPFSSAGVIDGYSVITQPRYQDIKMLDPIASYYGCGYNKTIANTMNLDLHLVQNLDFFTKGLSVEVKGAYNTDYSFIKKRKGSVESYIAYYQSELEELGLTVEDPNFNKELVYQISGANSKLGYEEDVDRGRNWYFETSVRYNRKFGNHNVGGLLLYNQNKRYYPSQFGYIPTAYVGLVGRATYDYKSRYMAEFNIGYNGSENFAPDKRFGTFPALSLGYIISEESFMKNQQVFDFLKLRASVGLVGNDNMNDNRYLYLPNSYDVDKLGSVDGEWKNYHWGYNFGFQNSTPLKGAVENRLGNPNVTWETALKQNYGVDMNFLSNRLRVKLDFFREDRKDILIARQTIPLLTALTSKLLPVVNMGKVENKGYEVEVNWNDKVGGNFDYYVNANMSYSKNKIKFQDEVEPNETYLWRTGQPVGSIFGYVAEGFYAKDDFIDEKLKDGLPVPKISVQPGDVKYKDLNEDGLINENDQKNIGYPTRPNYVFGLNFGANYKGFFFSMNWTGAAQRSLVLSESFRRPFNGESRGLMQYHVDHRWTEETAGTATQPRFSFNNDSYNYMTSTLWVKNGSYLKLKNLTLGYNFTGYPTLKKIGISQLGLKFTAYNLLTFDHFGIMDPESNPNQYNDTYPVVKIFNLGVNLTF
ncbi:SusC/RagA family TonB-linked outer membrane protein [Bacteroides reticulotermitis]|uniref:TonB-dependent receptor n=2 Tax=Bacteroides reticulotermitis TaxID=1133319 RepID=W4USW4_9BACE|nr:TonB-dependent receptor [Bacteroides reticulotermitis]MBB4043652.1 TonB-linked SusC/RagA family outer membrane protein [Bacteroides reticulotermitis]GAE83723.1 TonB-dependent receptor [Bacteroides reticulotermitis JCM 10512]